MTPQSSPGRRAGQDEPQLIPLGRSQSLQSHGACAVGTGRAAAGSPRTNMHIMDLFFSRQIILEEAVVGVKLRALHTLDQGSATSLGSQQNWVAGREPSYTPVCHACTDYPTASSARGHLLQSVSRPSTGLPKAMVYIRGLSCIPCLYRWVVTLH